MKRIIKLPLALLCVAIVGVIGFAAWRAWPESHAVYTDAYTIREPVEVAVVRDVLWRSPERMGGQINSTGDDYEPRLSADGLTLYFVRGKAGGNADLFVANRTAAGWEQPRTLAAINSEFDELGPEPSADGKALYFYSDRPGGLGGYDLWMTRRGPDGWREPANLGAKVNTQFNDYGPALTPDGETLYFASNRPGPGDTVTSAPVRRLMIVLIPMYCLTSSTIFPRCDQVESDSPGSVLTFSGSRAASRWRSATRATRVSPTRTPGRPRFEKTSTAATMTFTPRNSPTADRGRPKLSVY